MLSSENPTQKMTLYFTYESRDSVKSFSLFITVKAFSKLYMERSVKLEIGIKKKLAVVVHVLQTTQSLVITRCCFAKDAKKFTKIYNARAQLLFCSLKLFFSDVTVAVAVVIFLNSSLR